MKDIQKIKEFFSKRLQEENTFKVGDKVTYLGHPGVITGINKEMGGGISYNVAYDKGTGRTKATNIWNKDGEIKPVNEAKKETAVDIAKKKLDALGVKYEMSTTDKVRPFKVIYQPINKSDEFYDEFEDIVDLFNLKGVVKTSMNEAKEEDKVDTITMDVPLFIRMLEYSREDAAEDMDLHDVTEKANKLGKERGILQMDDYEEIIGATEDINELSDYFKRRKAQDDYAVNKKDKPAKPYNPNSSGKTDYMKRREKELSERISEALNKINEELCPAGKAYIKKRKAAGEKSSAYLSGRAVKVCKGQMSGKAKKKTNESLINEGQKINQNLNNLLNKIKKDFNIDNEQI